MEDIQNEVAIFGILTKAELETLAEFFLRLEEWKSELDLMQQEENRFAFTHGLAPAW